MIEVTLSWMVTRPKVSGGADCLTSVADFVLDDSASALGPAALRDSLLKQLTIHFCETVYFDVLRLTEVAQLASHNEVSRSSTSTPQQ
ncbi:hypothetical protein OVA13_04370 [Pseudoxanthomonas sp. SL93]|uniref:hypothetical protein n=1 Tax=Pseudoxanthomonas sp. SL93 TaxID=2995142 RepID=UPI00226F8CB5|nr:hypothetical protein [Pseudoxanthomonas sp. SL93]WAC64023.1 hypothetical protein OVA13_04370 [Pseudoxanthomonas sp. SL93]